jgi:hypothetical protein
VSGPWIAAGIVAGLWLLATLLQLGDVATVFLDSRTARDRDVPGRIARERLNELFWTIPLAAIVALAIGVGIDHVVRYFFDTTADTAAPSIGTLFLLGLAVLVVGVLTLSLGSIAATDRLSYSALRREMREVRAELRDGERIAPLQLAEFHTRLTRIDQRARSRMHTRHLLLTAPSIIRLASVVLGLFVVIAVSIAVIASPDGQSGSLVVVSILAPIVSAGLAALGIRLAFTSDTAWRRVYAKQRIDILKLLEDFDRASRKRVAGLGDRVARALKILGEQQAQ